MVIDRFFLAQVFGFLGLITAIISVFQKSRRGFIIFMILQSMFLAVQYYLLDKIIAVGVCMVSIVRLFAYIFKNKWNITFSYVMLAFFVVLNLYISIATFEIWYDIFPLIASTLVCYTIWQNDVVIMKWGLLMSKILWLVYASISLAYFSIILNIFVIVWTSIYLINNYKNTKN